MAAAGRRSDPGRRMTPDPAADPGAADAAPLVSVVTPVYNGERTLRRCIESVVAQTYTNWQYTLVDNCSSDASRAIAAEYAARDARIRVVGNRDFVPVMRNYNLAVAAASPASRYVKVVAADDYLFPECLQAMVALARAHPRVAIVGAYAQREDEVCWDGMPHDVSVMSGREACRRRLLGGRYVFGTPTSVMYATDIVLSRERFFNEENLHGDSEACVEFLQDRDFGFVHQVLSFQRTAGESTRTYSQRMQTYLGWEMYEVARYGPLYLGDDERERRLAEQAAMYYRYLGKNALLARGPAFWRFHRQALARSGQHLSWLRVAVAATGLAADAIFNPLSTLRRIAARLTPAPAPAPGSTRAGTSPS